MSTVAIILESARTILVKYGYVGFTTRRVAEEANISRGNLSYHFPSKQKLLQIVIKSLVVDYTNQFNEILSQGDSLADKKVEDLVSWLLNDAVVEQTVRIYRELWAMSLHDETICRAVDDFYDDILHSTVKSLKDFYPNADLVSIQELVTVIGLLSEGAAVIYGTRKERAVKLERVIEVITPLLKSICSES